MEPLGKNCPDYSFTDEGYQWRLDGRAAREASGRDGSSPPRGEEEAVVIRIAFEPSCLQRMLRPVVPRDWPAFFLDRRSGGTREEAVRQAFGNGVLKPGPNGANIRMNSASWPARMVARR